MKIGFINAYADKPLKKYYSYHGEVRDCLTQPNPSPFEELPYKPPGPPWVLVGCWYPSARATFLIKLGSLGLLNSSDPDPCVPFPGFYKQYYFMEVVYHKWPGYSGYGLINNPRGSACSNYYIYIYDTYTTFKVSDWAWPYNADIYWHNQSGPGTKICIWKSANGELPGYDPTL